MFVVFSLNNGGPRGLYMFRETLCIINDVFSDIFMFFEVVTLYIAHSSSNLFRLNILFFVIVLSKFEWHVF